MRAADGGSEKMWCHWRRELLAALLAVQAAVSSVPVEVDREETFGPRTYS